MFRNGIHLEYRSLECSSIDTFKFAMFKMRADFGQTRDAKVRKTRRRTLPHRVCMESGRPPDYAGGLPPLLSSCGGTVSLNVPDGVPRTR